MFRAIPLFATTVDRRRAHFIALLGVFLSVCSCAGERIVRREPLTSSGQSFIAGAEITPAWALMFTAATTRVEDDITIVDVHLAESKNVLAVSARLVLLTPSSPRYPAGVCTSTWPPAGFGGTIAAKGAKLVRGSMVAFAIVLQARDLGTGYAEGVVVHYERGRERGQVQLAGTKVELRIRATPEEVKPENRCDLRPPTPWFSNGQ